MATHVCLRRAGVSRQGKNYRTMGNIINLEEVRYTLARRKKLTPSYEQAWGEQRSLIERLAIQCRAQDHFPRDVNDG